MAYVKQIAQLCVLSCIILLSTRVRAQDNYNYEFNALCIEAYEHILCLQFDSAQQRLDEEERMHPKNLIPQLLRNYKDIIYLVLTEDKTTFESIKHKRKERLRLWSQGPQNNPWHKSGEAQIKLQWAFAHVLFNEYFTAARQINSAYHLLEDNHRTFPNFMVDNMGIGILHSMIGLVPDQYQWAVELFGFKGSINQGITEVLEQIEASPHSKQLSAEALFYYTFLKANLQSGKNRLNQLLQIFEQSFFKNISQKSPLLHFAYSNVLLRQNNDSAITVLRSYTYKENALHFYYLDFLLGKALVYKNDPAAVQQLQDYIQNYPGNNYKKSALQGLAWYHFMQNDTSSYRHYMSAIATTEGALMDADKSAEKESELAAQGKLPNVHLLKGRLFFDGHYYQKALEALQPLKQSNKNTDEATLLEYHYRKGRILQEMGKTSAAIAAYQSAITYGKRSGRYFAGRAALESGIIHEQLGNATQAKAAYKTCLSLPFSEYRRGIRAKAKAGLQRLK